MFANLFLGSELSIEVILISVYAMTVRWPIVVNFGVLGVMRNVRSDRIGRAMFCEWYGFPFLSDILSREQHMLYADSSPVSGGTVLIKTTRNNSVWKMDNDSSKMVGY
jgi:hypothetical protein